MGHEYAIESTTGDVRCTRHEQLSVARFLRRGEVGDPLTTKSHHELVHSRCACAALVRLGRRDRQRDGDRTPAGPHAAGDHAADEAARGPDRQDAVQSKTAGGRCSPTKATCCLRYAKSILKLHDELLARLSSPDIEGHVILGTPDLYAAYLLPSILALFRQSFPRIQVELRCSLSTPLVALVQRGEVDIALVTRMRGFSGGQVVRQEQLIWMMGERYDIHRANPVPLALLPPGNIYRDHAIEGLERAGRKWRIACVSESVGGLQAAVFAGMAVTVLGKSALVPGMRQIGINEYFPPLPEVDLLLYRAPGSPTARRHGAARLSRALSEPATEHRAPKTREQRTAYRRCRASTSRRKLGQWSSQGRAASNAAATRKMRLSSSQGATICMPIGNPSRSNPHGIVAAGRPARLIGHENGDQPRCGSTGRPSISSTPSVPASNAVTATVGVTSTSTRRNNSTNRLRSCVRRCIAST